MLWLLAKSWVWFDGIIWGYIWPVCPWKFENIWAKSSFRAWLTGRACCHVLCRVSMYCKVLDIDVDLRSDLASQDTHIHSPENVRNRGLYVWVMHHVHYSVPANVGPRSRGIRISDVRLSQVRHYGSSMMDITVKYPKKIPYKNELPYFLNKRLLWIKAGHSTLVKFLSIQQWQKCYHCWVDAGTCIRGEGFNAGPGIVAGLDLTRDKFW